MIMGITTVQRLQFVLSSYDQQYTTTHLEEPLSLNSEGGKEQGANFTELIYSNNITTNMDWILNDNNLSNVSKQEQEFVDPNTPRIPKVISKIFYNAENTTMPPFQSFAKPQRDALLSWSTKNPGYKMQYFGLDESRLYLKTHFHPIFLRTFDCIEAFAGKADLFRAAVIYREGGFYSDFKEQVTVDGLLDMIANSTKKPVPTLVVSWDKATTHSRQNNYIMNAFFGAQARHPCKFYYSYFYYVLKKQFWISSLGQEYFILLTLVCMFFITLILVNSFFLCKTSSPSHLYNMLYNSLFFLILKDFAQVLRIIVRNVHNQFYGEVPQSNTGPGAYAEAYQTMYEYGGKKNETMMKEFPMGSLRYQYNRYYYRPYNPDKAAIVHKYEGLNQNKAVTVDSWTSNGGNSYRSLHDEKRYYCPAASKLFDFDKTEIIPTTLSTS